MENLVIHAGRFQQFCSTKGLLVGVLKYMKTISGPNNQNCQLQYILVEYILHLLVIIFLNCVPFVRYHQSRTFPISLLTKPAVLQWDLVSWTFLQEKYATNHPNFTVISHKQGNVYNVYNFLIFVSVQSACSPFGDLVCFKNNGSAVGSCQQVIYSLVSPYLLKYDNITKIRKK